jgi:hypothetical protein
VVLEKVKSKDMKLLPLPTRRRFWIGLGVMLLLMQNFTAQAAGEPLGENPAVFFSRGQAIFSPGNASQSQHEAIQDLLVQAIIQATAAVVSTARLGEQYQLVQEKILKQPQRYVRSYQIFSENPNQGGLYRVAGQVSVAMDLLKKDLTTLGLTSSEGEPSPPGPVTETAVKPLDAGVLVLQIRSRDAYADWLALEKTLREQLKDMQVKGFEIGPEQSIVRLDGVDETSLRNLHGTRLPNGTQVQITSLDGENQGLAVTFMRSEISPAEPQP